ncbi:MAG: hypothetical protein H0U81_06370, partial [Pyrinomonadaceae bacterium]|nr:hypothetical protein [Pyrinomonadaceae bacterium]
ITDAARTMIEVKRLRQACESLARNPPLFGRFLGGAMSRRSPARWLTSSLPLEAR